MSRPTGRSRERRHWIGPYAFGHWCKDDGRGSGARVRPMLHQEYRDPAFRQFRDELLGGAPREQRLAQLERAERLLAELDPGKSYHYDYLVSRIADARLDQRHKSKVTGDTARHDLRLFV